MSLTAWLPFAAVCLSGAISPGPSFVMVIRNNVIGARFHGIGTYALFSIIGLVILIQEATLVFQGLSWAGAAYLIWLG